MRIPATALAVAALGACGGGGSGTPGSAGSSGSSPIKPQTVSVYVKLFVPKAKPSAASASRSTNAGASRGPLYLPATVNSVSIQPTESGGSAVTGAPVTVLVIGGPNCVASTGGQTCTIVLQGALGQDAWAIESFVTGNGSGTALSLNTGTLVVVGGAANVLSLTLNPVLAGLAFVPVSDSVDRSATSTLPLVLQAVDTAGAVIIGPGTFVTSANVAIPITLASSSAAHVVLQTSASTAAAVTITTTGSNDLAQIGYDGSLLSGSQTVTASATGITTATFTLTLTLSSGGLSLPASISLGADLGTTSAPLAIAEPGFGGTFSLTSSSCTGIVSFPATSGPGPSTTATVTQAGGGTCTILVSDGTNSGSVTVYSTTIGIVLQ